MWIEEAQCDPSFVFATHVLQMEHRAVWPANRKNAEIDSDAKTPSFLFSDTEDNIPSLPC